jgi:hypothetical protein
MKLIPSKLISTLRHCLEEYYLFHIEYNMLELLPSSYVREYTYKTSHLHIDLSVFHSRRAPPSVGATFQHESQVYGAREVTKSTISLVHFIETFEDMSFNSTNLCP